jgi:hypothetical protein
MGGLARNLDRLNFRFGMRIGASNTQSYFYAALSIPSLRRSGAVVAFLRRPT